MVEPKSRYARRDLVVAEGPPDPLDAATPAGTLSARLAIDATAKLPGEGAGPPSQPAWMSDAVRHLVADRWPEYGLGPAPE
jgi:3-polyprenyl-4-hydroxybenzoate decarboxylase